MFVYECVKVCLRSEDAISYYPACVGWSLRGGGGVFDKQGQGLTVELRKLGVFFFFKVEQALFFYLFFLGTLHEYEC